MNETSAIRHYMRNHQDKMVHVVTSNQVVDGRVFLVGTRGIWFIDQNNQDCFVQYESIRGYSDRSVL